MDIQKAIEWQKSMVAYFEDVFRPVDKEASDYVFAALKELEQYRKIGTLDECREEREKQVPKKPENISSTKYRDGKGCSDCDVVLCHYCRKRLRVKRRRDYCDNCGQAIDWSGERGEAEESSLHEGDAGQV